MGAVQTKRIGSGQVRVQDDRLGVGCEFVHKAKRGRGRGKGDAGRRSYNRQIRLHCGLNGARDTVIFF